MTNLSRRNMLRQLTCGGLVMALPASALALAAGDASPSLASRLRQFFSNRESARTIGRQYLALRPDEASLGQLTTLICRTPEFCARLENADSEQLRRFLSEQQRSDFEHDRIVSINGWLLSETETRLCAIATVAAPLS